MRYNYVVFGNYAPICRKESVIMSLTRLSLVNVLRGLFVKRISMVCEIGGFCLLETCAHHDYYCTI